MICPTLCKAFISFSVLSNSFSKSLSPNRILLRPLERSSWVLSDLLNARSASSLRGSPETKGVIAESAAAADEGPGSADCCCCCWCPAPAPSAAMLGSAEDGGREDGSDISVIWGDRSVCSCSDTDGRVTGFFFESDSTRTRACNPSRPSSLPVRRLVGRALGRTRQRRWPMPWREAEGDEARRHQKSYEDRKLQSEHQAFEDGKGELRARHQCQLSSESSIKIPR